MKKLILPLVTSLIFAALSTGCIGPSSQIPPAESPPGTTAPASWTPDKAKKLIKVATQTAAGIAIVKKPKLRGDFVLAKDALNGLLTANNFDAQALRETLAQIDVAVDDEIWIMMSGVIELFEEYTQEFTTAGIERSKWAGPMLLGVRDGLLFALASTSPPSPPAPVVQPPTVVAPVPTPPPAAPAVTNS